MKQYVNEIKDSFVDYAGETHHFIVAAVTTILEDCSFLSSNPDGSPIISQFRKEVRLGVSICNPCDTFDEKKGSLKAIARAKNSDPVLYSTDLGHLNSAIVESVIAQEAKYIKSNPELYIKGYKDSQEKYQKKLKMKDIESKFTETEKNVVSELQKDPRYLDNVNEYLAWLNNQEKGKKCKKSTK